MKESTFERLFVKQLIKERFEILHDHNGHKSFVWSPFIDVVARKDGRLYSFELKSLKVFGFAADQRQRAIGQCLEYFRTFKKTRIYERSFIADEKAYRISEYYRRRLFEAFRRTGDEWNEQRAYACIVFYGQEAKREDEYWKNEELKALSKGNKKRAKAIRRYVRLLKIYRKLDDGMCYEEVDLSKINKIYLAMNRPDEEVSHIIGFHRLPIRVLIFNPNQKTLITSRL